MKRYGFGKRNLFILMINTYNNEKPCYEILPLRDSDIKSAVIFCGKLKKIKYPPNMLGHTCLYLETNEVINENNYFKNVQRLLNLIWLVTDLPVEYFKEEIEEYNDFESIYNDYKCNTFYDPNIICGKPINNKNPIARISQYSYLINKLSVKDHKIFDNALNTYIWAKEITRIPNFHLKYTLFMTLFLSSINQLANKPQAICIANGNQTSYLICEKCKEKTGLRHETSHINEIEKLIRELITGKDIEIHVKKVKKMYHELRSAFLHDGLLRGSEKEGGFIFGVSSEKERELVEDMINIEGLNRKLLELFLQKRQTA